jgi:hypothetical protein
VHVNQGVIASFLLVLENTGSWCFLQVGACKSGGRSLLSVGAEEIMEVVLPSYWCLLLVGVGEFGSWYFL